MEDNLLQSIFGNRRMALLELVKAEYPSYKEGAILLIGACDQEHISFRQERSFYYLSGLNDPGLILLIDLSGKTTLFIPQYQKERSKWCNVELGSSAVGSADQLGVDEIAYLGDPYLGYSPSYYFTDKNYKNLFSYLRDYMDRKLPLFTLMPQGQWGYVMQRFVLERMGLLVPGLSPCFKDISSLVACLRRKKDKIELEHLYQAMLITSDAFEGAATLIRSSEATEKKIQAAIDFVFIESGANASFPSIVAGGKNASILHHTPSMKKLQEGELVLIDIGAEYHYYGADITRTFPVSGSFSKRQKELYAMVLKAQDFVAAKARPGMYLFNQEKPSLSLHHLAVRFFEEQGYAPYFCHTIGHFLGLDPHDVGDPRQPLEEGDVITIEPGLYLPDESIGIRIEDDYWVTSDGVVCISEDIPKKIEDVEAFIGQLAFSEDATF